MKYEIKGNYINGEFILAPTSGTNAVTNIITRNSPANFEQKLWLCPITYQHIDPAVDAASDAFKKWRSLSVDERISYLRKYQEIVLTKKEEIASAISLEMGKPYWEALTEAGALPAKVAVTISDSLPRIETKHYDNIMPETKGHIFYKPIGPCFVIGPFNFPCHLANGQILSALIAGNTIILKPSERTMYSAQLMIEAFHEAGFPPGVVNLIQGDGETARRIIKDKRIKGVFFTGSKEVGQKILKQTTDDLSKLVQLELGGKNSAIIHKDANLDNALAETLKGAYLTTGQRCTAVALVPIHRSIQDEFISRFHAAAKNIIVDHPIEHDIAPFMGPLVDEKSAEMYLNFMSMAKREGIEEVMRGKQLEKKFKGNYVSPSIHLANSFDHDSHFLTSEIFGPNVTFVPYDEIEEAIEISNATEYGLAAAVFTKDQSIYEQCVLDIDAGIFNLNRSTVGASSKLPFGGVKNSGNYRPAAVATIDACVYQMASLEINNDAAEDINSMKGIKS